MNRQEIISEVAGNLPFFHEKWAEFCRRVEKYAGKLDDLIGKAQAEYKRQNEKNRPETQAAIAQAQEELGPAQEVLSLAGAEYEKSDREYEAAAERLAIDANRRLAQLVAQLRLGDDQSIVNPASVKQIKKEMRDALKPYQDGTNKLQCVFLAAAERFKAIQGRTDPLHYSAVEAASTKSPGPGYVWTMTILEVVGGSTYSFVRVPLHSPFWKPADLVNPASWFGLTPDCPQMSLSPDDQVLHDAVVLCVAYDDGVRDQGGVPRIYPNGTYDRSRYFRCDEFVRALAERLRQAGSDLEVELAWQGAEGPAETDDNSLERIILKDFDQTVFDEIVGTTTRVGIEYLVKHVPGKGHDNHPDPKTVRCAVDRLCGFGLAEDNGERNGIMVTPKGRQLAKMRENDT